MKYKIIWNLKLQNSMNLIIMRKNEANSQNKWKTVGFFFEFWVRKVTMIRI